jgi:hypothetical protein
MDMKMYYFYCGGAPLAVVGPLEKELWVIRAEMKRVNITAYLVPSTDAHQSEYLAPEDRRMQYITGEYLARGQEGAKHNR